MPLQLDKTSHDATERMFAALREWAVMGLGTRRPPRPEELIFATPGLEDIDIFDVYIGAMNWFGIPEDSTSVNEYLLPGGSQPDRATWRGLALFLASQLGAATIEPATVLGSPCGPAGAFYLLHDLVARAAGSRKRVAPSDRIDAVISGTRLMKLWTHARRYTDEPLPPLLGLRRRKTGINFIALGILSCFACMLLTCVGLPPLAGLALLVSLISFTIGSLCVAGTPRVHESMSTFRDLAKHMWAASQNGPAPHCDRA